MRANGRHDDVFTVYARATSLPGTARDLWIGLAAASVLVLARRLGDADVLTLDERHFRVLAAEYPVRLLPADS